MFQTHTHTHDLEVQILQERLLVLTDRACIYAVENLFPSVI